MLLSGSAYKAPTHSPTALDEEDIKAKIKVLVPKDSDKAMYDCDIVKEIQKTDNLTNDQIMECLSEVYEEYNPIIEEEPIEV